MKMPEPIGRPWLLQRGFQGFHTLRELRLTGLEQVPTAPGVYAVIRESETSPTFLPNNPGGRFKGRDPTVPVERLGDRWCATSHIVYIGKAGAAGGTSTLRKRVASYLNFGAGKPVGHWGGRLTWQLDGTETLLLAWSTTQAAEARKVEAALLQAIVQQVGRLPFANLRR